MKIFQEIAVASLTIADYIRLLDIYAFLRRKITDSQVLILCYHRICPDNNDWSLESIHTQLFKQQIEYIVKKLDIISLDELVKCMYVKKGFPKKAAIITFDDGYLDNYLFAYPILKENHIPATIFLVTGPIESKGLFWWDKVGYIIKHMDRNTLDLDELGRFTFSSNRDKMIVLTQINESLKLVTEDRKNALIERLVTISGVDVPSDAAKEILLSWEQVREMSNNGITFGAHTVNHPILTNMPIAQAKWEVIQSKRDIENVLKHNVNLFSYPNGNFNNELISILKENGFKCAVSLHPRKFISSKSNVHALNRFPEASELRKFKGEICGLLVDLKTLIDWGRQK